MTMKNEIASLNSDIEAIQEVLNEEQELNNKLQDQVSKYESILNTMQNVYEERLGFLTAAADEAARMIDQELRVDYVDSDVREARVLRVIRQQVLAHRDGKNMAEEVLERIQKSEDGNVSDE